MLPEDALNKFRFAKYEFRAECLDNFGLPEYKGATFRGGFGSTFKRVVCVTRNWECTDCMLRSSCVYLYVFETPRPNRTEIMTKATDIPRPFVIEPPMSGKNKYELSDELRFNLVLIGKAIDYLPYFIFAFKELGRCGIGREKGKYSLKEVTSGDNVTEAGCLVYDGKTKKIYSNGHITTWGQVLEESAKFASQKEMGLRFLTLTRIKDQQCQTNELTFHILIKNLLRRTSLLAHFHCGNEPLLGSATLIEESKSVKTKKSNLAWSEWQRYSRRQKSRVKVEGFTGCVLYQGSLGKFLPYIYLGQYIHVGNGATFGLGKFDIIEESQWDAQ